MNATEWTPPNNKQLKAAGIVADLIVTTLITDGSIHIENAIATSARLAGTFLFRSFDFEINNVNPGQTILSKEANDHWPHLIKTLSIGLRIVGVDVNKIKIMSRIPSENKPVMNIGEQQIIFENKFENIRKEFELSLFEMAHACALSSSLLINFFSKELDPHLGFNLASEGFIEGSKTVPEIMNKGGD